jgi:C-terminal processing protease CtpA/Prc
MNMTGISLIASTAELNSFEISHIRPDSPADKAGLRIRDHIISINDVPVNNYSLSDLYNMFRQEEGRILSLKVNRMGKELIFSIQLERFI